MDVPGFLDFLTMDLGTSGGNIPVIEAFQGC